MRSAIRQTVRQRVVLSVEFIAGDFTKSNSNTVLELVILVKSSQMKRQIMLRFGGWKRTKTGNL